MCGIFLYLYNKIKVSNLDEYQQLFDQLNKRGPDFNQFIKYDFKLYEASLFSSVLDLRGDNLTKQPIIENDNLFQWNGELYEIINDNYFNETNENDTLYLFNKLSNCEDEQSILNLISNLRGEFSFIYYHSKLKTIYFGRDYFGRRSLCWNIDCNNLFINQDNQSTDGLNISNLMHNLCISSIAYYDDQYNWTEIQANGIYKLCLDEKNDKEFNQLKLIQWQQQQINSKTSLYLISPIINSFNFDLLDFDKINEKILLNYELEFLNILRKAVELRVMKQNFKCKDCTLKQIEYHSSNKFSNQINCNHSTVAILFSGGLDSTVLALLTNEFMPQHLPIDLINLAFSQDAADRQTGWSSYLELKKIAPKRIWNFIKIDITPEQLFDYRDRIIKKIIYPLNTVLDDSIGCAIYFAGTCKGKLIQDNLCLESLSLQESNESDEPNKNINDLIDQYPTIEYESTSKILLLGQGADEQLSGYARHRTTFRIGGWQALQKEQNLDIDRISFRNLGRDDRMISANGRESRYPYLDENVVSFLNSLPTNIKCDLRLPKGEGDKLILRKIAKRIGLKECCKYEKRAIQFGSKIAKLENKKEKAVHISKRLI